MNYTISDFKTGQKIDTPAKIRLWNKIINETFGGYDIAVKQYENHSASRTWQSYKINGMVEYLDQLTGYKYGKEHPAIKTVAGTLSSQFKKKFSDIRYLMYKCLVNVDTIISPEKNNEENQFFDIEINKSKINKSKCHHILADIYSKNPSISETKFIAETLIGSSKRL